MKQIFTTDFKDLYKIHFDVQQKKKNFKIMNICACDTETSSAAIINGKAERLDKKRYKTDSLYRKVWDNAVKISILYMWQFGIYDKVTDTAYVFWGRNLEEYRAFLEALEIEAKRQALNGFKCICRSIEEQNARNDKGIIKLISFIHNLPFDFQILRNIHDSSWSKHAKGRGAVFAREKRHAMKAVASVRTLKIEYRDSLVLVNMSLAKWGQSYKLPVCKIKVDEDFYLKVRTPKTPLTQEEIDYGCTDIVTLLCGVNQFVERYGTIYDIPLTQAGTARQSMIAACAINPDWMLSCYEVTKSYGLDLFKIFVKLQDGGYVHANSNYVNKLLDSEFAEKKFGDKGRKIYNFDYSSDYPYCACVFKHPIGHWVKIDPKYFDQYASVDVLESKIRWFAKISCRIKKTKTKNSFWSLSHILNQKEFDGDVDNGRIRNSKNIISLYIADVEWDIFSKVYEIEDFKVEEMYGARAGRMCTELIEWILDRYCAKTELKREDDDPEYEETLAAYNHAKVDINAGGYGVFVTKVLTPGVDFDNDGWHNDRDREELSIDEMYEQTMQGLSDKKTFTQYPIGIWITKWAKWRLWSLLIGRWFDPLDRKAVYMDTDSMKGFFTDKDLENIAKYNVMIEEAENAVAAEIGIDPNKFAPCDKYGKSWRLGLFTQEKTSEAMVTLGAKKYAVQYADGKIKTTIAGLPKKAGPAKFKKLSQMILKSQDDEIEFDIDESMKKCLYYNDEQPPVVWIDENGEEYESEQKYGCAILPTTFKLSMSSEFYNFVQGADCEFFNNDLFLELLI